MAHIFTVEEKVRRCIARHPDWPDRRIALSINKGGNCKVADVKAIRLGLSMPQQQSQERSSLISLKKIIEKYDIRTAILHEIAKLPEGQLILEADLCKETAGTDRNRFRRTVENNADEFRSLRIKLKLDDSSEGKWYWGHPGDIAEAQRIRDL